MASTLKVFIFILFLSFPLVVFEEIANNRKERLQ